MKNCIDFPLSVAKHSPDFFLEHFVDAHGYQLTSCTLVIYVGWLK